jgi:hypothetical protein
MTSRSAAGPGWEELAKVETWLTKNDIAASALGRLLFQDQALVSRWRRGGCSGVSADKRHKVLQFIEEHPTGHPQLRRKRRVHHGAQFTPASSAEPRKPNHTYGSLSGSSPLPVPSLEEIRLKEDVDWIKARAFSRQVPIAVVLAELVMLGVRCERESEYEERVSANGGRPPDSES